MFFCCPNATPPCWPRVAVTWLGTGVAAAVPAGMELSHRGGLGWAEPKQGEQAGLGSYRASPAHLGTAGGSQWRSWCHPGGNKEGWALCTHRWRCSCWGHVPVPAGTLQAGGGSGLTSECAMAASSSSLLPHLPLGCWLDGHSKGHGCTQFRICFLTDDFSCCSLEGGLQLINSGTGHSEFGANLACCLFLLEGALWNWSTEKGWRWLLVTFSKV